MLPPCLNKLLRIIRMVSLIKNNENLTIFGKIAKTIIIKEKNQCSTLK